MATNKTYANIDKKREKQFVEIDSSMYPWVLTVPMATPAAALNPARFFPYGI